MFTFKEKHNKSLYNNLVNLSRNIFFYKDLKLNDVFFTRVLLIFIHFSIILNCYKNDNKDAKQKIYDDLFFYIECHLRESGLGDVSVNTKMKDLNRIFYDITLKIKYDTPSDMIRKNILTKYFYENLEITEKTYNNFNNYFKDFRIFCEKNDISKLVLNKINFTYGST